MKNKKKQFHKNQFFLILFSVLIFTSCGEQKDSDPKEVTSYERTTDSIPLGNSSQNSMSNLSNESPAIIKTGLPSNYEDFTTDTSQVSQYIRSIWQDKKGNLWFGTVGDGVCRYDGKSLTYYSALDGFSGNNVQAIAEDSEGNLWFGTTGGVSVYDGKKFTNYSMKNGLGSDQIMSILIEQKNKIWIGTSKGISFYEDEKFHPFPINGTGDGLQINSILKDQSGKIWFATNGNGVWQYDPSADKKGISLMHFTTKEGLSDNTVMRIFEDKKGKIWFSTFRKGLTCHDPALSPKDKSYFRHYTTKEGLPSDWRAGVMKEDPAGKIWLSLNGEIICFDPYAEKKSFVVIGEEAGLTNGNVQCIFEDRKGNIWFGSGAGLFIYDGISFKNVTKKGPWPKEFR